MLIYELLSGEHPFQGTSSAEMLASILQTAAMAGYGWNAEALMCSESALALCRSLLSVQVDPHPTPTPNPNPKPNPTSGPIDRRPMDAPAAPAPQVPTRRVRARPARVPSARLYPLPYPYPIPYP